MGLPQLLFTILLFSPLLKTIAKNSKTELCLKNQRTLLLEMRKQLVFSSSLSTKLVQWNQTGDCCSWKGVGCDGGGRVVSLQLYNEGISGGLDESSSLFRLEYLEELDLSENALNGSQTPWEFHKLTHLTSLNLRSCSLKGYFSDTIFYSPTLQILDLSQNPLLRGSMPQYLRNNSFTTIKLSYTSFSGSLPDSVGNMERLSILNLSHCKFTGSIPRTLSNLTRLVQLYLSNNFFSGSISSIHFETLSNVEYMDLGSNLLTGTVPISIFTTLPSLLLLDLSDNQFSDQVGEFPIVNISTQLSELDLSSNRLESPIPNSFFNLQNLRTLSLSHNMFNHTFQLEKILSSPNLEYLDLSSNNLSLDDATGLNRSSSFYLLVQQSYLKLLDLSNNKIAGEIPSWVWEIGNGSLLELNLSCNMLVGLQMPCNIPASLSLRALDLHSNQLRGELPSSLLEQALYVDYSNNRLSGSIPTSICNATYLEYLNLSSNSLSGTIPSMCIYASLSLQVLDFHSNQLHGELPLPPRQAKAVDYSNNYFDSIPNNGNFFTPFLSLLSFKNNRLSGSFPTFICNATSLEVLDLSSNNFSGNIPDCVFEKIEYLELLNLGRNKFSGLIPDIFSLNCNLQSLDLSENDLVGYFPLSLNKCRGLKVVNLSNNKLSGTVPTSLCNARELEILDLSVNNFNGNVPLCLLEYLPVLNLGRNNITGLLQNFSTGCPLQYIDLSDNSFIGELPQSLANCKRLEVMNVGGNYIDGTFPCMLPSSLRVLVLRSNQFHGEIRCNKSWPNLQIIDIASNSFSGYLNRFNFSTWRGITKDTVKKLDHNNLGFTVRTRDSSGSRTTDGLGFSGTGLTLTIRGLSYSIYSFFNNFHVNITIKGAERKLVNISPDFTSIDMSCNNFKGDIPKEIGGLDALYLLNLSHNGLTGTIPKSFSNLTSLGAMDLSVNRLTGEIPKEIAGITFLQAMDVSNNELVGQIPVGTQIQSFPADCFEGNLGLCGLPLNIRCSNINLVSPPPESDKEIEWEYVFAAAGYAVGLGIFSWLLLFCRSFRYKYFERVDDYLDKIFYRHQHNKRRDRRRRRAVRNEVRRQ